MQKILPLLIALLSISLSAQSIRVRGTIKDTIGNPLEFANVIASIKSSGEIESYGITNHEGRFQLDLPKGNTYLLRASFLGYETQEKTLEIPQDGKNMNVDFVLKAQESALDDVELVYEMPVTIKGDTIIYNADSFTTGNERKLGDVLKKMPGVEVNKDGEIQVEGKTVQKVMVEGKDFFDGDSKLATKNIPADAVDKVEVLRNYNEVTQMRGLGDDRDNVAINIKLKEGKKNFWFGEVTAGAGIADASKEDGRYLAHPRLFYYSPEYSLNLITDFNNIGEVPFTMRDYFQFTGGFRNLSRRGGTSFNISNSDLGFAISQNDKAKAIDAKFVAGNFSYMVNPRLDMSGFLILNDSKTDIVNNSIRQYILTGITEETSTENNQRNQLGMLKLSSSYKPHHDFQLDYDAIIKTSMQGQDDSTTSIVLGNQNAITEAKKNKPFSINQNVNAYYTLNEKNIFAFQVQHLYQDEDPFYRAIQDSIPFRGVFTDIDPANPFDSSSDVFDPLRPADRYDINQDKKVKSHKLDAKADHYYILNRMSNINFSLGTIYSHQAFNSGIFQILDNGDRNRFNAQDFNNNVDFSFLDMYLAVHYKLRSGQFVLTPGLTLHNYQLRNEQLAAKSSQEDWRLLPDLSIVWEIKKSENIRFTYSITSAYSDVNYYAQGYVFNSYNRLFRGNRELENAISHSYNLSYFNFNLFNYTTIAGGLNYNRRIDVVKTNTSLVGINQVSSPVNFDSNFPDETFSGMGRFSRRIKKIEVAVRATMFLSRSHNVINTQIRESESFTQDYNLTLRSNFKTAPNFEIGYNYMRNEYDNGGIIQRFYTNKPFANVSFNFLKDFELFAEWDLYDYTNGEKTVENRYSFVNANLYYRKGESPWELSLRGSNLLNTLSLNNDSFSDQFNITRQYLVMPRILMFVVKYDL